MTALSECLLREAEAISDAANQLDDNQVNNSLNIIENYYITVNHHNLLTNWILELILI